MGCNPMDRATYEFVKKLRANKRVKVTSKVRSNVPAGSAHRLPVVRDTSGPVPSPPRIDNE